MDDTKRILKKSVDDLLSANGFHKSGSWIWERDFSWKKDVVVVHTRLPDAKEFLASIRILLPIPLQANDNEVCFYEKNVPSLLGKKSNYAKEPLFFGKENFIKNFCNDIELAVKHFDFYKTPRECLGTLDKIKDPNAPIYKIIEQYLEKESRDQFIKSIEEKDRENRNKSLGHDF
ncbi:MAG: hypothetical protein LBV12_03750 [Puniceicoccales bacterium]|jgi:hypothetical protein|nr:hypothetical protein [Puniceicoccales bacterium]